eukprot:g2100.t1
MKLLMEQKLEAEKLRAKEQELQLESQRLAQEKAQQEIESIRAGAAAAHDNKNSLLLACGGAFVRGNFKNNNWSSRDSSKSKWRPCGHNSRKQQEDASVAATAAETVEPVELSDVADVRSHHEPQPSRSAEDVLDAPHHAWPVWHSQHKGMERRHFPAMHTALSQMAAILRVAKEREQCMMEYALFHQETLDDLKAERDGWKKEAQLLRLQANDLQRALKEMSHLIPWHWAKWNISECSVKDCGDGGVTWSLAILMAKMLAAVPEYPRQRGLELGAGTGLASATLRGRGHEVVLSDGRDQVIENLQKNWPRADIRRFRWHVEEDRQALTHWGPFDFLLGANLLMDSRHCDALHAALPSLLLLSPELWLLERNQSVHGCEWLRSDRWNTELRPVDVSPTAEVDGERNPPRKRSIYINMMFLAELASKAGWVRATVYLLAMLYLFLGVNIAADKFVAAIEGITSTKRRVLQRSTGRVITVCVWNGTVANLTLLALGSSAPEILLSVVEIIGNGCFAGELGPSTIVGSAAFNLFCIIVAASELGRPGRVAAQQTSEWSVDQVSDFLETLGLEASLRETFRAESVDGRTLCEITDEDLSGPGANPRSGRETELAQQRRLESSRQPERGLERGPFLVKGDHVDGPQLSRDALERIRTYRLEASTGRLVPRQPPLSDEELDCWQYQASWLVCPVTGKAWARSDVVSTMGVALYHAPRFCSEKEKQRLFVEEENGPACHFERSYEVYPMVEPPPLANLPVSTASNEPENAEQLQSLRAEVSGLKSRSAAVQRQMFEGLSQDGHFGDFQDWWSGQLKVEPADDAELAHKFSVYESYFASVVDLRADLFGLWERGGPLLAAADAQTMRGAIGRVDSFDNLAIPERSRHWFDIDAYNDGVKGNPSKGILAAADRGILDMDRQYNAVNFQYFAQQAEAGVTRAGAEASFKRRLCTSRLSFYIEESHGSRIFPRNILSQLSLLFYRRNDALRLANGQVNELRVAVCIRKAIPRMLRAIVLDVFQGDRNFTPHVEKAEWIQQPFCAKSDAEWPDLEELLLGSSLCSVPWSLLREAFVRKLVVQLLETTTMNPKAPIRQRAEHLFNQHRNFLERLTYILSFFQAGPGKLPIQEMDKKYSRPTQSSEGPALPPSALEQLASIGAESGAHGWPSSTGTSRREREMHNAQRLAAEKALHQGFPKLPPSRRLDGTMCYYCQKRFPSRMALFAHLRRLIDKE